MPNETTAEALTRTFNVTETEFEKRENIGRYIHSFSGLIADRFFHNYVQHDPMLQRYLGGSDLPRIVRQFSNFFASLFIAPLDEALLSDIRKMAAMHAGLRIEPIQMTRGFNILTEIIIDLAAVNTQIRDDLNVILKVVRMTEAVCNEYFTRASRADETRLGTENEMLAIFDRLYGALAMHRRTHGILRMLWQTDSYTHAPGVSELVLDARHCPMTGLLDELERKQSALKLFDIDLDEIRRAHEHYHEAMRRFVGSVRSGEGAEVRNEGFESLEKISKRLFSVMDRPLQDVSTTSFLAIHSGMRFLQSCSQTIHEKSSAFQPAQMLEFIRSEIEAQLHSVMGWCIDRTEVSDGELDASGFDLHTVMTLQSRRIQIGVVLKEIPNKLYITEVLYILFEILKASYLNKEREQALIRLADQAEEANRSKDMFLANMSHELRTPLNAIIGFSQILMMNKTLPENLQQYIGKISIAGNNLLTLVNTILDFAKLEAGKLNFKPEMTVVSGVLNEVATIIEPMAQKKRVVFHYPEMVSLGLYMDRQLITQVLINLLSNAVKFTPEEGQIELTMTYDEEHRVYRFGVIDTGIGIAKEHLATLFDPFTQVENPFQKSAKGTGLGLAIAKKIVEDLHGGRMWVQSEEGKGSAFYFTVPILQSQDTVERYASAAQNAPELLIVEDSPEYQKMLVERLEASFEITVTNSINRAKKLLDDKVYDFIILDFFLIDGISSEVLQHMERNDMQTPVIIISAEDDSRIIAHIQKSDNVEGIFNKADVETICSMLLNNVPGGSV